MKQYTLKAIDDLISRYIKKGGEVLTISEGVLGYGKMLLTGKGLKTIVITEKYVSDWSSTHTIIKYNKTPKKYMKILETI